MIIEIRHNTTYRFAGPVQLGRHRLRIRPRDSFDMRILDSGLLVDPVPQVSWSHDVYGNTVCQLDFEPAPVATLTIASTLVVERWQSRRATPSTMPWTPGSAVAYTPEDVAVLQPFSLAASRDDHDQLYRFALDAAMQADPVAGHPLTSLAMRIHEQVGYRARFEEGTQAPLDTLAYGNGACRDMAWLFVEAARRLGYAARFVTGYLHCPPQLPWTGSGMDQHTHAWAEAYLPGDGWVEFDPTNRLVGDSSLIRVAVTRTPEEAAPVSGSYFGLSQLVLPEVDLSVTAQV